MDAARIAQTFCLAACGMAALGAGYFFLELAKSVKQVPVIVESELDGARKDAVKSSNHFTDTVNSQIEDSRNAILSEADKQANITRNQLAAEVQRLDLDVNGTITAIGMSAIKSADKINTTLDIQLATANRTLDKRSSEVTVPLGKTLTDVSKSSDLFFDCDHNQDCAFNRFQGTSKAIEQQSQTMAKELPGIADSIRLSTENVAEITKDVKIVTDKIIAPKPWYVKAWDLISTGATLGATFGRVGVLK